MLHTVVYGVLVVGGICLLALLGFELVHRLVPANARQRSNDVAGFIYAALGVIYAVLLALVVIAVWEEFGAASETVEQEASATAEIFWLAGRLPEPEGTPDDADKRDPRRMDHHRRYQGQPSGLRAAYEG